jgi:orotate phosphoribosyltransferase
MVVLKHKLSDFEISLVRDQAIKLIRKLSFSAVQVDLSSRRASNYYLDMKPTMFNPEGARVLAELILDRIGDLGADFIGGLETGAVPLVTPVVMLGARRGAGLAGFFVRKKAKDHGLRKLIEGVGEGELAGKRAVILDDVTTTGASAMAAVEALRAAGAIVVLVLSVVDRGGGAREFFAGAGVSFDHLFAASEIVNA